MHMFQRMGTWRQVISKFTASTRVFLCENQFGERNVDQVLADERSGRFFLFEDYGMGSWCMIGIFLIEIHAYSIHVIESWHSLDYANDLKQFEENAHE